MRHTHILTAAAAAFAAADGGGTASCSAHPGCSALGISGECCPASNGVALECCGESGESAARHGIRGERPNLPRSWDQKVVDLIRNCWAHEPAARPSFLAILDLLDELATAGLVEADTAVVPSAKACCVVS